MVRTNIHKILVPIANSKEGKIAMNQALYFHQEFSSRITLLHIIPPAHIAKRIFEHKKYEKRKKRSQKKLIRFVKKKIDGTIPDYIDFRIVVGDLVPTILKIAEKLKFDLIIIKKSIRIKRLFYHLRKHNTDRIIGSSPCPVLTIKETWTEMGVRDILLPVDISKRTSAKVMWAIELARKFNAKIRIVSILRFNINIEDSYAYKKCENIKQQIMGQGIECEFEIVKSKEHTMQEAVQLFTERENPDLTIIMTHQESAINENYIGKFATEIIHNSLSPVLSIVPQSDNVFSVMLDILNIQ